MKWLFRKASKPPKAKLAAFRDPHGGSKRLGFPRLRGLSKKPKGGSGKGPPGRKRKESSEDDCTSEFQFQVFPFVREEQELLQRREVWSEITDSGAVFTDLSPTSAESAPMMCSGTLCTGRCPTCHSILLHRRREKPLPLPPTPTEARVDSGCSLGLFQTESDIYDEIPGTPTACMRAGHAACRKRKRPSTLERNETGTHESSRLRSKRARRQVGFSGSNTVSPVSPCAALPALPLVPPPLPPHREPLASMLIRTPVQIFDRDSLDRSPTASEKVMGIGWSLDDEYSPVYDIYDEFDDVRSDEKRSSNGSLEALLRAGDEVRRLRDVKRELPFTADELDQWLRREMEVFREQLLLRVRRASLSDRHLLPCIETDL